MLTPFVAVFDSGYPVSETPSLDTFMTNPVLPKTRSLQGSTPLTIRLFFGSLIPEETHGPYGYSDGQNPNGQDGNPT